MLDQNPLEIVSAHSPDSDDAFMFYGLATRKVRSTRVTFRHVLSDIETLNRKAVEGIYDLSAISYHAYPYVVDKYVLMASGSSVGDGYGPMVVALHPMEPEEIKGKKIAIPGTMTTAYLSLKIFEPDFEPVIVPFDKILETVTNGGADAGLIIHEAQLTYNKTGFHRVLDMGRWWKDTYDLPLPLGCNVLLRVEKLMAIEAPPRARVIRTILTELQRIASHLVWLGTHALDIGALTPIFYCFREREEILKIFEKYCGARLTTHAFRIGGLQYEAYDTFEHDTERFCKDFMGKGAEIQSV